MPRNFFRFPAREQVNLPPAPPPKAEERNISAPIPLTDTIRARRVTSPPNISAPSGLQPKPAATRLPHRASASDSFAQGFAWRGIPLSGRTSEEKQLPRTNEPVKKPDIPTRRPPPLRRSKGHQPIADERVRRTKGETLEQEQTKLKREINEETIRLRQMKQMQQALREEREKVESARRENERLASDAYYVKSQSTPTLPQQYPYHRGRTDARSNESFQSASSQDQDYRRVRTPSASSNDRSPPPAPHWQRVEQARRERERERALLKLAEARALEKKAFEEAWSVYESRWMLLNFATKTSPLVGSTSPGNLTLSFRDIPWPLLHPPRTCEGITTVAIRMFLASEHQASDKSSRERIKEALLRWHPDRFQGRIMEHVRTEDRDEVKKGVDIVVRCLNELLSKA